MVADGGGDLGPLTGGERVVTAHHALLAGELDDGVRHEVRLGKMRGALGLGSGLGAHAGLMGDGEGEVLEALGLLQGPSRASPGRYGREPGAELLERHLQVSS